MEEEGMKTESNKIIKEEAINGIWPIALDQFSLKPNGQFA